MGTSPSIKRVLGVLHAMYPYYSRDLDPGMLEASMAMYERLLSDLPIQAVEARHPAQPMVLPVVAPVAKT